MKRRILALSILLFTVIASQGRAEVTEVVANVDKNPVMVDESLTLTLVANDRVDAEAFDASVLAKDFVVRGTSVSTQTRVVNFSTSASTVWTTRLIPRQPGQYTLPAFNIAGVTSQPIRLHVLPVSAQSRHAERNVYVTASVDKPRVYTHQQIIYTLKLHLAQELQSGSLLAPELEGADVIPLGKDKESQEIINGKRYRIIERRFALLPGKSGRLTIEPPLFEGNIVDLNSRSRLFGRTKTITRRAQAIDIEVLPAASPSGKNWLPSELVQLNEEWQPNHSQLTVGEPVTRIITLTVQGVSEHQLPNLDIPLPKGVKVYPEQPQRTRVEQNKGLVSVLEQSIGLVPNEPGTLVLPEVRIPWFNVTSEQQEVAILPARTIEVIPAPNTGPQQMPTSPVSEPPVTTPSEHDKGPTRGLDLALDYGHSLLFILWLATLTLWWLTRRGGVKTPQADVPDGDEPALWHALNMAMAQKDAQRIVRQLTLWLRQVQGMPTAPLSVLLDLEGNAEISQALNVFMDARFGRDKQSVSPATLKNALSARRQEYKQQNPPHAMLFGSILPTPERNH